MSKIITEYLNDKFEELSVKNASSQMQNFRKEGFKDFNSIGLPTVKTEEWKYTLIRKLFTNSYSLSPEIKEAEEIIENAAIPGLKDANYLVFVNGVYQSDASNIVSEEMVICTIEEAYNNGYKDLVEEHFGKSKLYMKDGIHALNTSFMDGGTFILIKKGKDLSAPIYFNHIFDTTQNHLLANPRSLVVFEENSSAKIVESYHTHGVMDSFCNEVMEIIAFENAIIEHYKIQNDSPNAHHTGTVHVRQIGKCLVNTVTITLDGGMIRNNTNIIMEKEGNEAHMYGLYFTKGRTHVDNSTIVDNREPNCFSNELYKGVIDEYSTGVFSGKIYVRPDAQKINAYQTNNNILLSKNGTVNTKPQLEIYADDVKCSHGCTVGRLDEEALYYLRSRGINEKLATAILIEAYAQDVIEHIKLDVVREYVQNLIHARLKSEN